MNIKQKRSKTVHIVVQGCEGDLIALCGANVNYQASNPYHVFRGKEFGWVESNEPVNCKRCLKIENKLTEES